MRKLWTPTDVADFLGVPTQTIYQWRSRGTGPAGRRIGTHLRYKPDDVETWIDQQPEGVI